jgi:predicted RNA-binding Zn-ribbon protein involved in translation (DUF1610 family)
MVTTYTPPDQREAVCPSCGAAIKAPASPRARRVQCPKCREVIVIESRTAKGAAAGEPQPAVEKPPGDECQRIIALEERVSALEAAMAQAHAADAAGGESAIGRKLQWVPIVAGAGPAFSPAQGRALAHNLGTVPPQEITLRVPAGDLIANVRAEWFKTIFQRAGWQVHGPQEIAPELAGRVLSLAVPELPVAEAAAKTYLALKAAGFEPIPVLDPEVMSGGGGAALSLMIPPAGSRKALEAGPESAE